MHVVCALSMGNSLNHCALTIGKAIKSCALARRHCSETEPCDLVPATVAPSNFFYQLVLSAPLILLWPMCALSPVEDSPHNRTGTLTDVIAKSPNVL